MSDSLKLAPKSYLIRESISALNICNLDARFSHVATALDAHDFEELTLTKITALLMNEEARQEQGLSIEHTNQVKRNLRCIVHPNLNHSDEQCYTQHPELRPSYQKVRWNKQHAEQYELACKATIMKSSKRSDVWHIDTGCSNHMTFETNNFIEL